jgi:hypothetical protein
VNRPYPPIKLTVRIAPRSASAIRVAASGATPLENRRMSTLIRLVATAAFVTTVACAGCSKPQPHAQADAAPRSQGGQTTMKIYYLEIVTKDVDAVCAAYAAANGVQFGQRM